MYCMNKVSKYAESFQTETYLGTLLAVRAPSGRDRVARGSDQAATSTAGYKSKVCNQFRPWGGGGGSVAVLLRAVNSLSSGRGQLPSNLKVASSIPLFRSIPV